MGTVLWMRKSASRVSQYLRGRAAWVGSGSHQGAAWMSASRRAREDWLHILLKASHSRLPALSWQKALHVSPPNSPQENRQENTAVILKMKLQITFLLSADQQGCNCQCRTAEFHSNTIVAGSCLDCWLWQAVKGRGGGGHLFILAYFKYQSILGFFN